MKKKKILVVDDEVDFQSMIKLRLEANGYEVINAYSGKEALDKAKNEKPDAILLDIMMPGMDGIAVLTKIRQDNEKLPVFIITGFSNEERFKLAGKYNASGFILKTNDLQEEIKKITAELKIAERYKK